MFKIFHTTFQIECELIHVINFINVEMTKIPIQNVYISQYTLIMIFSIACYKQYVRSMITVPLARIYKNSNQSKTNIICQVVEQMLAKIELMNLIIDREQWQRSSTCFIIGRSRQIRNYCFVIMTLHSLKLAIRMKLLHIENIQSY